MPWSHRSDRRTTSDDLMMRRRFDRPIFIIGCARSGTTALAAPFFFSSDTGPKLFPIEGHVSLAQFADHLMRYEKHIDFSESLERKDMWSRFFKQKRFITDMGKELIVEKPPSGFLRLLIFQRRLVAGQNFRRLFSKSPTHSFRVVALQSLFPDAKFVVIHRDGRDVVSSWGNRWYGFEKMGVEKGIRFFAQKWNETIDYLLQAQDRVPMHSMRFEDMIARPEQSIRAAFDFCELSVGSVLLNTLSYRQQTDVWKGRIPAQFHALVEELTHRNNKRLGYIL